jgi:two-component system, response regulator PdtaR
VNSSIPTGIVLVAEPDQIVCMVAVDMLTDAGFRTATAFSLHEVLSALTEIDEVRVLVMGRSLHRPGDGIELSHRVRQLRPDVHIIITSGIGGDLYQDLPSRAALLQKPYSFGTLVRLVEDGYAELNHRAHSAPLMLDASRALVGVSASVGIGVAATVLAEPDKS